MIGKNGGLYNVCRNCAFIKPICILKDNPKIVGCKNGYKITEYKHGKKY